MRNPDCTYGTPEFGDGVWYDAQEEKWNAVIDIGVEGVDASMPSLDSCDPVGNYTANPGQVGLSNVSISTP